MTVGFIAGTIPAKIVSAAGTTLFQVAMVNAGDALLWVDIAELNNIIDPWITTQINLKIPPVFNSVGDGGILGL